MHILLELSLFPLKPRTHLGTRSHKLDSILQRCRLVRICDQPAGYSLLPLLNTLLFQLRYRISVQVRGNSEHAYLSELIAFQAGSEPLRPVAGVLCIPSEIAVRIHSIIAQSAGEP